MSDAQIIKVNTDIVNEVADKYWDVNRKIVDFYAAITEFKTLVSSNISNTGLPSFQQEEDNLKRYTSNSTLFLYAFIDSLHQIENGREYTDELFNESVVVGRLRKANLVALVFGGEDVKGLTLAQLVSKYNLDEKYGITVEKLINYNVGLDENSILTEEMAINLPINQNKIDDLKKTLYSVDPKTVINALLDSNRMTSGDYYSGENKMITNSAGRPIISYKQAGSTWGSYEYFNYPGGMGEAGCPVASAATLLTSYGMTVTPGELFKNGYTDGSTGLSGELNIFLDANNSEYNAVTVGNWKGYELSSSKKNDIVDILEGGNPVIVYGTSSSDFACSGHFFVLGDYNPETNKIFVASSTNTGGGSGWYSKDKVLKAVNYYCYLTDEG